TSFGSSPSVTAHTSPVTGSVPSSVRGSHVGISVGGTPGGGGVGGCQATLRTVPSPPPVSVTVYSMVTDSPAASGPDHDRNDSGMNDGASMSEPSEATAVASPL